MKEFHISRNNLNELFKNYQTEFLCMIDDAMSNNPPPKSAIKKNIKFLFAELKKDLVNQSEF
jgi:hypothetical protein